MAGLLFCAAGCHAPSPSAEVERRWAQLRWRGVVQAFELWHESAGSSFAAPGSVFATPQEERSLVPRFVVGAGGEPANARIVDVQQVDRMLQQRPVADPWLTALYRAASDRRGTAPMSRGPSFADTRVILLIEETARFERWLPLPAQHDRSLLSLTVEEPQVGAPLAIGGELSAEAMLYDLNTGMAPARFTTHVAEEAAGYQMLRLRDALRRQLRWRLRRVLATLLPADALPSAAREQ